MREDHPIWHPSRRTILGIVAASLGVGGASATTNETIEADADNLVAGNDRLTITLDGVSVDDITDVTVVIDDVAFARVDVVERERPVLVIDHSNLVRSDRLAGRTIVAVDVEVSTGNRTYLGSDVVQVVRDP